jgi:hypothetical protein
LAAKVEPYVDAARVAGARPGRIMFGHILPNVSQSIPVLMTLNASESILTLAGLGFLGFGIEPNSAAEWGYDLNKARSDIANGIWWTAVFPGLAIVLIVVGVTLIGESLNDVLNPLLRTRGGTTTADEEEVAQAVAAKAELVAEGTLPAEVEGNTTVVPVIEPWMEPPIEEDSLDESDLVGRDGSRDAGDGQGVGGRPTAGFPTSRDGLTHEDSPEGLDDPHDPQRGKESV